MSGFSSMASEFARDAAVFAGMAVGERVIVTAAGGDRAELVDAIVLRKPLAVSASAQSGGAGGREEFPIEVQIPMASYPGGKVTVGVDTVAVLVRLDDARLTTKTVSAVIGQVAGMWHVALD